MGFFLGGLSSRNVVLSATESHPFCEGQMARPVFFCAGWEVPPKKNGGFLRIGGNPFFQMKMPDGDFPMSC